MTLILATNNIWKVSSRYCYFPGAYYSNHKSTDLKSFDCSDISQYCSTLQIFIDYINYLFGNEAYEFQLRLQKVDR